jgi:methionine-rich copper-binding protein CopC
MKSSPLAALSAILAALFVLGTASPALAHDTLKSSDPAKGATVKSLDEVKLEFNATPRLPFVIVRDAGGSAYQQGEPVVDGPVVRQAVKAPLPDGAYTIAYRIVSSDGHPVEGEIPFTVKGASPPPSQSAGASAAAQAATKAAEPDQAADGQPASFPVWLLIVVGALVGIGVGFLLSARKKKP